MSATLAPAPVTVTPVSKAASDALDELARVCYLVAHNFLYQIRREHPTLWDAFGHVVFVGAAHPGAPWGVFRPNRWQRGSARFHQLDVNLTPRTSVQPPRALGAIEVFDTIVHELSHLYAQTLGIEDTSGNGVEHNKEFARLATSLGVRVRQGVPRLGHVTDGPTVTTQRRFADHLQVLAVMLDTHLPEVLKMATTTPRAVALEPGSAGRKLDVFDLVAVRCSCPRTPRSIAPIHAPVAWWARSDVRCGYCNQPFREQP